MPTQCVNPPAIGPRAQRLDDMVGQWWIAQTRPQYEKKLARYLGEIGTAYYLPLVNAERVYGGKRRKVLIPAFPMYVFVNGDVEDRYRAARSDYTNHVIDVRDQSSFASQLKCISPEVLKNHPALDPTAWVGQGRRCKVKVGHDLYGQEAWIDGEGKRGRVTVRVTLLGQSTPLEIAVEDLEPMD